MNNELNTLLEQSNRVYLENFPNTAYFGRCIFVSWFCAIGDCDFCYRTTIKSKAQFALRQRRSIGSILCEAILARNLGWQIEFVTGGYGIYPFEELVEIVRMVKEVFGEKIWLNLGALSNQQIEYFKPYIKGVYASLETLEPNLHNKVCPSKPIESYTKMFNNMKEIPELKKGIAIIIGLGEKKEDIKLLHDYIEQNNIDKITFYALKPIEGTPYTKGPETEYYAWWIAQTRIKFPKLDIIAGTTARRVEEIDIILRAGANAITKFPATKLFNSPQAKMFEKKVTGAGRIFDSTLTKFPDINWNAQIDSFNITEYARQDLKEKIQLYIKKMSKPMEIVIGEIEDE